jgi:hypothetical protein
MHKNREINAIIVGTQRTELTIIVYVKLYHVVQIWAGVASRCWWRTSHRSGRPICSWGGGGLSTLAARIANNAAASSMVVSSADGQRGVFVSGSTSPGGSSEDGGSSLAAGRTEPHGKCSTCPEQLLLRQYLNHACTCVVVVKTKHNINGKERSSTHSVKGILLMVDSVNNDWNKQ